MNKPLRSENNFVFLCVNNFNGFLNTPIVKYWNSFDKNKDSIISRKVLVSWKFLFSNRSTCFKISFKLGYAWMGLKMSWISDRSSDLSLTKWIFVILVFWPLKGTILANWFIPILMKCQLIFGTRLRFRVWFILIFFYAFLLTFIVVWVTKKLDSILQLYTFK